MKYIYLLVIAVLLNNCGGENSTTLKKGDITNTLKGACLTNYPSYVEIKSSMIKNKTIYDNETADNLDMTYIKYDFSSDAKLKKTIITQGFLDFDEKTPTIINSYYSLIDGGVLIKGKKDKAWLFILDRIDNDNSWTMLRQEVINGTCADHATPTTLDFIKTGLYPKKL